MADPIRQQPRAIMARHYQQVEITCGEISRGIYVDFAMLGLETHLRP
jgi:hypothetical protein